MLKYYEPKYFVPQEYVPPEIYMQLGDNAFLLIDDRVLKTDDAIREFFGKKIIINNWHLGGERKYSGFRPFSCHEGAIWSQHRYGRASDKLIIGIDAAAARQVIIENSKNFPYITVIEDDVPWLHTDCRCTSSNKIQLIKP